MCYSQDACHDGRIGTNSGILEELLARYNRALYDRDLAALRALYVPDVEVPCFDNHAGCDSTDLETHLEKVATFFETGDIVPMLVENVRAFVRGDAARVVATVRYSAEPVPGVRASFFPERHATAWRIRHIHFSQEPNETST